jgi:hypothetical protein
LKLDLIGAALVMPAIICFLLALQWGGVTYPWQSGRIIGLFVTAGVLVIAFIALQFKLGDEGTIPPRLFKQKDIVLAFLFAFVFGAGFFALIFYLAIYFQSVLGSSATKAGIQMLPLLIATVLSSIVTGGLITAVGFYVPIMIFCMALFAIGSGLITTFALNTPLSKWFGYQVIAGLGIGVGFQSAILVIQTILPMRDIPVATACVSFFQTLGGSIFIAVAQTLFQKGLLTGISSKSDLPADIFLKSGATEVRSILAQLGRSADLDIVRQAYVNGLTDTFWISCACAIAGFFLSLGLKWRNIKKGHGQDKDKAGMAVAAL